MSTSRMDPHIANQLRQIVLLCGADAVIREARTMESEAAATLSLHGAYPEATNSTLPSSRRFRWTGRRREPRKGEWFLSGSIIEAYQAPNDLPGQNYPIAEEIR